MAAPRQCTSLTTTLFVCVVLLMLVPYNSYAQNKKARKSLIIKVDDFKEFKKLLKTKTNLLIICAQSEKATSKVMKLFEEVAEEMKGKATLAYINCGENKKFCKKIKMAPSDYELRHYKDGDFNKVYDRKIAFKSMVNFLLDPTGDLPWEEDPTANDVLHINSEDAFDRLLKKDKHPILVMFYAPWCGFCKRLKPDFAAAATDMKNEAILVGIDVDKRPLMSLRVHFNITGFPTLLYFEGGKMKYKYGGENNKAGIVSWLKNPQPPTDPEKETEWADEESDVVHLGDDSFAEFVATNPSVLVMFYAPWCGHCKNMKPGYTEAAKILKDAGITGVIAAVDATKAKKLSQQFSIRGFPTVKYFKDGEFAFEVNEREKDKIVEFMKDPKEPPPPPPPEPKWEEVESDVVHLTDENFKSFLKKKKHCLVMFYAPWCGHCKKAKPEFMSAAEIHKDDSKVAFAAIDCTSQTATCTSHDVTGYPTFKYFNYGKNSQKYMGGREKTDFVNFMRDPLNPAPAPTQPPPEPIDEQWKTFVGHESLALLNSHNFDAVIADYNHVLVMFYAPWCGHCKRLKPAFAEAADIVKTEGLGILGAVDCTIETELASKFDIKAYPTLKHFTAGKVTEYTKDKSVEDLVSFIRSESQKLAEEDTEDSEDMAPGFKNNKDEPPSSRFVPSRSVKGLVHTNFSTYLSDKQSALVMFYNPSCPKCHNAKPHFMKAAKTTNNKHLGYATVDCTEESALCERERVSQFPTFKLYVAGRFLSQYKDTPNAEAMRHFVENAPNVNDDFGRNSGKKYREDL